MSGLLFIILNFKDNLVFFYTPTEISEKPINNKIIRVGGLVKEKSLKKIDALTTEFLITDLKKDLLVNHVGMVPDLFRDNQGVVAKGFYDYEKNKFYSQELLIKHDENYMPPEVKNIKTIKYN